MYSYTNFLAFQSTTLPSLVERCRLDVFAASDLFSVFLFGQYNSTTNFEIGKESSLHKGFVLSTSFSLVKLQQHSLSGRIRVDTISLLPVKATYFFNLLAGITNIVS